MKQVKPISRRGSILVYSVYIMLLMLSVVSLAVDYGRIQTIKTEEQRCADATARGVLAACLADHGTYGLTTLQMLQSYGASVVAPYIYNKNPVDPNSGIAATYSVVVGSWYNNQFYPDNASHGPAAVQVIVSRTHNNNNPVPLAFPLPGGHGAMLLTEKYDVWAKAIAVLPNIITLSQTVQATYDPWLAGMPSGSTASYDDTAPAESPQALTVIPGSTLTVSTAVSGTVKHDPAGTNDSADGETSTIYWHLKDPPTGAVASGQGAQNNIGDVIAPIDSLLGVFLGSNQPDSADAPTTVRDYSSQTARDDPDFNDLEIQQPFYIGNGINSSGVTASFIVPNNATRFYMGILDGYEWLNNSGSFSTSFNEQPPIQMVQ